MNQTKFFPSNNNALVRENFTYLNLSLSGILSRSGHNISNFSIAFENANKVNNSPISSHLFILE